MPGVATGEKAKLRAARSRLSNIRERLVPPATSWPRAGAEVEEEFKVQMGGRNRAGGIMFYKMLVGLRLKDGRVMYRCAQDACPDMWSTLADAERHCGIEHPSDVALRNRAEAERAVAELEAAEAARAAELQPKAAPEAVAAVAEPEPEADPIPEGVYAVDGLPGSQLELMDVRASTPALAPILASAQPKRRGRPPRKGADPEDTLDFMGAEIADNARKGIDFILQSRNDNRMRYLAALEEYEEMRKQRDYFRDIVIKINQMTEGPMQAMKQGMDNGE